MLLGCSTVPYLLARVTFVAQALRRLLVLIIRGELVATVTAIMCLLWLLVVWSLLEVLLIAPIHIITEPSLKWLNLPILVIEASWMWLVVLILLERVDLILSPLFAALAMLDRVPHSLVIAVSTPHTWASTAFLVAGLSLPLVLTGILLPVAMRLSLLLIVLLLLLLRIEVHHPLWLLLSLIARLAVETMMNTTLIRLLLPASLGLGLLELLMGRVRETVLTSHI